MIEQLIPLILFGVIFAIAAWGAFLILGKSKAPLPAYWVVGAILLIVLLYFLARFV